MGYPFLGVNIQLRCLRKAGTFLTLPQMVVIFPPHSMILGFAQRPTSCLQLPALPQPTPKAQLSKEGMGFHLLLALVLWASAATPESWLAFDSHILSLPRGSLPQYSSILCTTTHSPKKS